MKYENYCKVRDDCHYRGKYKGAAHSICNLGYSVLKKIPIGFHDRSNYWLSFYVKRVSRRIKKRQFTWLGENTEKYITFAVPIEKKLQELMKMEKKLQKIYVIFYSLLIAQDLW